MNENDLRQAFAMFAMVGLFMKGIGLDEEGARQCWDAADRMLEARDKEPEPEVGIVAVKSRRKKSD
jgi:hypothetical protein